MALDQRPQLANLFGQILEARRTLGGFGSGGHNRRRSYCERHRRIEMRILRARGLLRVGASGTMSWSDNSGETVGSIGIVGGNDAIELIYKSKTGDGEWRNIEERVVIDRSVRPFGGAQSYMLCPACSRRALILYGSQARFLCRACSGLTYASSQERPCDRARRKADKVRRRLGGARGASALVRRPKHMRQSTFERLYKAMEEAEARSWDDAIGILSRLQRTEERIRDKLRSPSFQRQLRRTARFW